MKNLISLLILSFIVCLMLSSCIDKNCEDIIPHLILLPLEIENRNDTISMADSIVFYSKFYALGYDEESGRHYDFNDLKMIAYVSVIKITDSINIIDYPALNLDYYFTYEVKEGTEYGSSLFQPLRQNDSMTYRFSIYPKETGLYMIGMGLSDFEENNTQKGVVLNKDENGCILYVDPGLSACPGLNIGIENYNNFNIYYNSNLFWNGTVPKEDYSYHQNAFRLSYFVYVE